MSVPQRPTEENLLYSIHAQKDILMVAPKISVCIPTFNYARFLPQAIESVLMQKYDDFELLIIDNCSTDGTAEVVEAYRSQDKRIRFIVNDENVGAINNWNKCIDEARGEYIKFLLSDDLLATDDALSRMAGVLDIDPTLSLVVSSRHAVTEELQKIKTYSPFRERRLGGNVAIARCLWEHKNLIGEASAVMFRKQQGLRGFDARYIMLPDMEFWFYLLEQGALYHIHEPLCLIRRHSNQGTHEGLRNPDSLDDTKYLLAKYLHKPYLPFGGISRGIIEYAYMYSLWKAYKAGTISFRQMKEKMGSYSLVSFLTILPFYKLYRPLHRLSHGKRW